MYKGVLDRIETNDQAVILIEELHEGFTVHIDDLPEGSEEGTWFDVQKTEDHFEIIAIDHVKTEEKKNRLRNKLSDLKKRKGSSFKKE
ncbi:MAG TPA: DUF3006 domain-containing protein [Bacillota bacterium]|nr:DUF3006 domain-containing protein [Bacillota bacterium]